MNRTTFRTLLRWVENIIHLLVPLAGAMAAVFPELFGKPTDTNTLLRLILGLVTGLAISTTLERYVTLRDIENQTDRLSKLSNLELLRSANEAGIVNVYPRADKARLDDITETIQKAGGSVDICGVAMPTMVENEDFRTAILECSRKHDIRVLLLKPDSAEAQRRANIEAPLGRKTITDIDTSRDWIIQQQITNHRIRLHFYDLPPMLAMIATDRFIFVEPYHFGRPEGVEGCIGGYVPMLKLRNSPEMGSKNPYAFFKAHYNYLWSYTRGLRVNLPIIITDAHPSVYVAMENQTGKDINMAGWELTGQDAARPFQFSPNFTWKWNEKIVITCDPSLNLSAHHIFRTQEDFMGNNTILRLINAATTVVGEWSIPALSDPTDLPS